MLRDRNPYVGPRPFEAGDRLFFGRDAEVEDLFALTLSNQVVLFYAASGAGKSSLLNAGLVQRLVHAEQFDVLPITRVGSTMPDHVLADAANAYMLGVLLTLQAGTSAADDKATEPPQLSLSQFFAALPRAADGAGLPAPRALIIDQFEELFTFSPNYWRQRREFFDQIARALERDPLLRVVLALREDFLAQLDPYAELLPGELASRFRLERLGAAQALSAVVDPVRTTDRRYAVGVAEKLVSNLLRFRMDVGGGRIAEDEGEFVEPVQLPSSVKACGPGFHATPTRSPSSTSKPSETSMRSSDGSLDGTASWPVWRTCASTGSAGGSRRSSHPWGPAARSTGQTRRQLRSRTRRSRSSKTGTSSGRSGGCRLVRADARPLHPPDPELQRAVSLGSSARTTSTRGCWRCSARSCSRTARVLGRDLERG